MSQRKKKDKREESPEASLGATIATGAVVTAGVAALAFGAWKLYDFFSSTSEGAAATSANVAAKPAKRMCESSDDDDDASSSYGRRANALGESSSGSAEPRSLTTKTETSLSAKLIDYYRNYVVVSPTEVREVAKLVKDVKMQIGRFLRRNSKLQALNAGALEETGSSTDDMMVVIPEHFDVLIPFKLNPGECCISRISAMVENCSIVLQHSDEAWSDVCDDMKHLDPTKFIDLLREVLEEAASQCVSTKLTIHKNLALLEGCYGNGHKKFNINMIPALNIGERRFVAERLQHSTCSTECVFWRESFAHEELCSLNRFGPSVTSPKVILKIFKAIRLNFPLQFGLLNPYHYKTILLRIMDDEEDAKDWEMSAISERFIDFLIELGNCLKERKLPHYFLPDCNLFDQISPESSQNLAHFINKIVGHHDIASLLKYEYGQR